MTLEQYGGGVVCRYLARATRVIVASYKNEEASIFHRPTTAFSPISRVSVLIKRFLASKGDWPLGGRLRGRRAFA
jgi:hypothetical protein